MAERRWEAAILSVDVPPIADLDNQDFEDVVVYPREDPEVTDTIFPEASQRTSQRRADLARIFPLSDIGFEVIQDSDLVGSRKFRKRLRGVFLNPDKPRHGRGLAQPFRPRRARTSSSV